MARTIVITSGKGGVGKTSICSNIGYKLASIGYRVVLVDVDIGLNNLDVVMGVENQVVFDLVDVIENKCRVKQALIQDFNEPSLYIMPSAHSYNKSSVTIQNVKKVVGELEELFDYIILDCPAGIDLPFRRAVECSKEALVVVTPHVSSMRDADKVINILKNTNMPSIKLIVNRVRGDMVLDKDMLSPQEIQELLNVDIIGVVPEDDNVSVSSMYGVRVDSSSEVSKALDIIVGNIINGTDNVYDCTTKYRGLFGMIRRGLKRRV